MSWQNLPRQISDSSLGVRGSPREASLSTQARQDGSPIIGAEVPPTCLGGIGPPKASGAATSSAIASTPSASASATGLVVMDSSRNPIAFNAAAVEILCYPYRPKDAASLRASLGSKIRSGLLDHQTADGASSFVIEFNSGRRRYFCRVLQLTSAAKGSSQPLVALLLDRSSSELMSMSKIAKQFHLSPREREAVKLLLNGLTSKEIAQRMKVSVNTVKGFLRMVMLKTGASTRSRVVAKITTAGSAGFIVAE